MQAKAGVVGLSKTVAREWGAFNIRCNAIAYGFIATRLTASKDDGASISVNGEKVIRQSMQSWSPTDTSAGVQLHQASGWNTLTPKHLGKSVIQKECNRALVNRHIAEQAAEQF